MTKYSILYSKTSQKYLFKITLSKASLILNHLEKIALDPLAPNNNIKKLTGTKSSFRLRIGDVRVIYELDITNKIIFIAKIAPRGSVYSH